LSFYLDANATYGLIPEVSEALADLFSESRNGLLAWNPSSVHQYGQKARAVVEEARYQVAQLVGASRSERVVFTSGATESNLMALTCALRKNGTLDQRPEIVTTEIEHPSMLEAIKRLSELGQCSYKPVAYPASEGATWVTSITPLLTDRTALISSMLANNESGEILPVAEMVKAARAINTECLVHSDVVQAVGKVPVQWQELNVDMLSLSAHKLGGLPGVGALVVGDNVPHEPLFFGGAQETRWRAGTENLPGILSFGIAARVARETLAQRMKCMSESWNAFVAKLKNDIPSIAIIGEHLPRLPNTALVHFAGIRADDLVVALDLKGVAVSSGAACASGKQLPSHVLMAMGSSEQEARECVRFSMRADLLVSDAVSVAELVVAAVESMKR
jgi:cysteine desulfurase